MNVDLSELALAVLEAQPFSRLVGARLTTFSDGVAEIAIDIGDTHLQQFGLVHGGIWCYAADNALTFAAGSVLGPSVVTAGLSIQYLEGARSGTLRALATVVHHDLRHATCRVELRVDQGSADSLLCAVAMGTAYATRGGHAAVGSTQEDAHEKTEL